MNSSTRPVCFSHMKKAAGACQMWSRQQENVWNNHARGGAWKHAGGRKLHVNSNAGIHYLCLQQINQCRPVSAAALESRCLSKLTSLLVFSTCVVAIGHRVISVSFLFLSVLCTSRHQLWIFRTFHSGKVSGNVQSNGLWQLPLTKQR